MNTRFLACWLLGAWIAGSLFMILVATQNFRSVDRLLAAPAAASAQVAKLGPGEARTFLRYQVSEQNRFYFETWEKIQLALALATLAALTGGGRLALIVAGIMTALLLAESFYLTPEIVRLGRLIDFVPQAAPSPERDHFWKLHGAYSGVELVKLALGFFVSGRLILGRR